MNRHFLNLTLLLMVFTNASLVRSSLAQEAHVALFGGSSVATTYLPEGAKHHAVLERELAKAYPEQAIKVSNFADNGEFIARYLLRGAYEKHRESVSGIDIAIIRFGTNDIKRMDMPEYRSHMEKFIELLKKDFPEIQIILETGMYVDYPIHYSKDRNKTLNPTWQVSRDIAAQDGYPLVEYYEAVKAEAAAGNWDVRVRARPNSRGPFVLDASQDAGKENDPRWFTDIHPNPEGVQIAVREEVKTLKAHFPEKLPSSGKALAREAKSMDDYSEYLNFPPARLERKGENPDQLQEATH